MNYTALFLCERKKKERERLKNQKMQDFHLIRKTSKQVKTHKTTILEDALPSTSQYTSSSHPQIFTDSFVTQFFA